MKNVPDGNSLDFLKEQNEILKNQLMNNSLINELSKVLQTSNDPQKTIKTILLGAQEIAHFDRIILFEIDKENFELRAKSWIGIENDKVKNMIIPLGFDGGDITDAIFLKKHIIIDQPDKKFDIFSRELESEFYMVIPIEGKNIPDNFKTDNTYDTNFSNISENDRRKALIESPDFHGQGVFWMDRNRSRKPITADDVSILFSIINQAGLILENIRIYSALKDTNATLQNTNMELKNVNRALREAQDRINQDLEHARQIQHGLLPQEIPQNNKLKISATYTPADAVGGDYYDVFEISEGVYGIIVADVSGHGVAASLIMTMVKVLLKTYADGTRTPQQTLEIINNIFQTEISTTNFVTVFYTVIDTNNDKIIYTSAGHCPILLMNKLDGSCTEIKADGLFLGVFPDMMLKEVEMNYTPHQHRLILFTDGLTEARNNDGVMFENKRLIEIAKKTITLENSEALTAIQNFQIVFCGEDHIPDDDITLLIIDF